MNTPHEKSSAAAPPHTAQPSFWRSMRAVGWGFLGIRKGSEYQRDLAQANPFHIILAGLIGGVMLVLLLLAVVNWVVAGAQAG